MKQVTIVVDKFGRTSIDAQGFKSKSCASATEAVEIAIGGGVVADKKKKPEFFMPEGIGQKDTIRRM